jgi:hypothetical protein
MTPFQSWLQSRNHNGLPWETSTKELEEAFEAGVAAWRNNPLGDPLDQFDLNEDCDDGLLDLKKTPLLPLPDVIYAAYPRKVGKQAALKAIRKAIKRLEGQPVHIGLEDFDILKAKYGIGAAITASRFILVKTEAYAAATATWPEEEKQYIPHCATWMNRGSYDDDPKEWVRGKAAGSQFGKVN